MSYIFDALQRAENERAGTRVQGAAELLQRAEREAAAQRRSARASRLAPKPPRAPLPPDQGLILEQPEEAAALIPAHVPVVDAGAQDSSLQDAFGTLEAALPLESRLVCLTDKESPAAEAFRLLGVRLRHMRRERTLQKLLITSTVPEEGKSMIAANLAATLAAGTQQPVLLLEGDVRRPSLLPLFKVPATTGLCDWLQDRCDLSACIWHLRGANFFILPSGSMTENPLSLIQSARLQELLDQLAGWFHWIVIDSPPVLPLADTSVWARAADGILLVARRGVTRRRHLLRGIEALDQKKIIGAVMNSSATTADHDYYSYRPSASAAS
jgi:capsular exopolysaccharide synthesis family protein